MCVYVVSTSQRVKFRKKKKINVFKKVLSNMIIIHVIADTIYESDALDTRN